MHAGEQEDCAEGADWCAQTIAQAERGEGPTLFEMLVEDMRNRRITVEEC